MFFNVLNSSGFLINKQISGIVYPLPIGMFSTILKNPAYTGPIFNVRRSSDSATNDVYSDTTGNYTVTGGTSYSTWIGANTGYVTQWYNQSGLIHMYQTTTANQPQLLPTSLDLSFNGTSMYFYSDSGTGSYTADFNPANLSIATSCNFRNSGAYNAVVTSRDIFKGYTFYLLNNNTLEYMLGSGSTPWIDASSTISFATNTQYKAVLQCPQTGVKTVTVNGTTNSITSFTYSPNNTYVTRIGAGTTESTPSFYFAGTLKDVFIYNTAISNAHRSQLVTSTLSGIYTKIFTYTGADQSFNIPSNITGNVNIKCWGAGGATQGGGNLTKYLSGYGGGGGYTEANFTQASMSGKTLTIIVGQGGLTTQTGGNANPTYGGGGGQLLNGDMNWGAASGGGRSAVRLPDSTEIITAGGGGGGGGWLSNNATYRGAGGAGGGLIGISAEYVGPTINSRIYGGKGGSQEAGGSGGYDQTNTRDASSGYQFTGGNGCQFGAGGGGGYYGGGGGGIVGGTSSTNYIFGGGGGGSSYINATYGTQVYILQDVSSSVAGKIYLPSGYTSATIGSGGSVSTTPATTGPGKPGLPGLVVITYTTL